MDTKWQTVGALAALFEALAYIIGFAFMLAVLQPAMQTTAAPLQKLGVLLGISSFTSCSESRW